MPDAEYQRDVGSGEQLAYGEATGTNESLAAGEAVADQLQDQELVPELLQDFGEPQYDDSDELDYTPSDDLEEILFGASEGLGPPMSAGTVQQDRRPVPNSVIRALPQLAAIANNPQTPPAIKAAYRALVLRLEAELGG